jgi:hypothetical protein
MGTNKTKRVSLGKRMPKNPFHPGEILLEEFLIPGGVSQVEFAQRVGGTRARLTKLSAAPPAGERSGSAPSSASTCT